mmetsp:Transcript_10006/g.14983  ORF Transcript_10006/g.14983 Transcript_10006/m.14983 type:complete len:429 (-) Transcript_10006:663-1949(-)
MAGVSMNGTFENHLNRLKESFLWAAAKGGRAEEVESLINLGANVNWKQNDSSMGFEEGDTALLAAVRNGHVDVAEVLMANGAQTDCQSRNGDNVLHLAAGRGDEEFCALLQDKRALVFCANNDGITPIDAAIRAGHIDLSEKLKYAPCNEVEDDENDDNYNMMHLHSTAVDPANRGMSRLDILHQSNERRRRQEWRRPNPEQPRHEDAANYDDEISLTGSEAYCTSPPSSDVWASVMNLKKEIFSEIGHGKLPSFENLPETIHADDNKSNEQLAGLWLMVKHFRTEKHRLSTKAEALAAQCNVLRSQLGRIESDYASLKIDHSRVQSKLYRFLGQNLDGESVQDLEDLEELLNTSIKLVGKAKEKAFHARMNEDEESRMCVICQEERKSVLLMPCRHLCCCRDCSRREELVRCPLCRINISQKIDVYS